MPLTLSSSFSSPSVLSSVSSLSPFIHRPPPPCPPPPPSPGQQCWHGSCLAAPPGGCRRCRRQ
eukprot:4802653-Pyramimonas_sp.AAC.1